jgi:non-specific serine/threonine protein kinase
VVRDAEKESEALQFLLSTGAKLNRDGKISLPKNNTLIWLMDEVPKLTKAGFAVYGEEKLKRYKVNRSPAQVRVAVESGIDWFDLKMEIDFGGILLSLKELRKALQQKSRFVKLADGSTAKLPTPWLERFRHVLNLSEEKENRLKLSHFHATLIDELFAQASQKTFDKTFKEALQRLKNFRGIKEVELPATLRGDLRPYQWAGYNWLHFLKEFHFGGCLADDMGLGKTIQALATLLYESQNGAKQPSLVVVPTSVVFNWLNEIARFAPKLRVLNQTGNNREANTKNFAKYDIVLTSYGTLRQDIYFLKDYQFNYVILDESQYIKNPISQTAKAARLLKANYRLALTGTPVENNTLELWSLFAFLNPGLLGNLNYFKGAFAKPIEQNRDPKAAELLKKIIFPFVLRRTKEEVEKDLPPKVENTVYCDMSPQQEKLYHQWRDYYRAALLKQIADVGLNKTRMNVLEGLMKLRQIACHPLLVEERFPHKIGKYEMLIEYLAEILAEGHKVLVFSQFVRMLTIIRQYLDSARIPYEYLDGKTRDRKSCVEHFQNDDACKIFLISLRAGGTGLNLTAADYVIHYDPWWNPAVELQATDRTHRIGQDKHVFVYKMITKDTVEEKILQLQERKKELVSNLISTDAGLFKHLTVDDIQNLFS